MARIILENMEFYAYHGVFEHEKTIGNTFTVTLEMEVNTEKAGTSDHLEDTVNYALIYNTVRKQMDIPSNLIEHLAHRIADKVMNKFMRVNYLKLKLSKQNPPLEGKVQQVSIVLEKSRT